MKRCAGILLLCWACQSFSQRNIDFGEIDRRVQFIAPAAPAVLAQTLVSPYRTEIEKTRAIFSWIASHISYRTGKRPGVRNPSYTFYTPPAKPDSSGWKSANETVAEAVLYSKSGVCDGYARLFKTLCDYAGIRAELVTGYARTNLGRGKFSSNHYWNAVYTDSAWHLLDVTWASGAISYVGDAFIKRFDDYYFMTPPDLFIRDHWPDDMRWTLLPDPPAPSEFARAPFRQRSFIKYHITSFNPSSGVIEASVGDTIQLVLETSDPAGDRSIAMDTVRLDSAMKTVYASVVFLQPAFTMNKTLIYTYVVESSDVVWLHLIYNKDVILRYRLKIRKDKTSLAAAGNNKVFKPI